MAATSLGGLDAEELAAAIRPLWEDAGPLVARLVGRPVASWEEHVALSEAEIGKMSNAERARLLNAHPRIGAPPAALASRSALSLGEQGGAAGAEPAVLAELDVLNDLYETKFGFPFVEWVAGRSRREMVTVLQRRLRGDGETELAAGCGALVAIARDRLARLSSR
jgi:2-oxo-4-hydroxy-4-carboxy--5-ureidoimidazoline (OHCU) decarboxylase